MYDCGSNGDDIEMWVIPKIPRDAMYGDVDLI